MINIAVYETNILVNHTNIKLYIIKIFQTEVGHSLSLECDYRLEGDSLYSLKWYRDDREFFRYIPQGDHCYSRLQFSFDIICWDIKKIFICFEFTFNFSRWRYIYILYMNMSFRSLNIKNLSFSRVASSDNLSVAWHFRFWFLVSDQVGFILGK